MPPPTPLSTPSSTSATLAISPPILRSAARDVYYIPELRQRILQLLGKRELRKFICANKAGFSSVVEELYRTIKYDRLIRLPQSLSPERLEIYRAAVRIIKADSQYTSADLSQGALRRKFVNLRQVTVTFESDQWWTVYIHAVRSSTDVDPFADIDRVEYFRGTTFEADQLPTTADFLPTSSTNFTIINWYNMRIFPASLDLAHGMIDSWRQAFKNAAWVSELGSFIDFGDLPVTFDDMINICNRQTTAGHGVHIQDITAVCMKPWMPREFEGFATVASGSIRFFRLTNAFDPSYDQAVTFDGLSAIMMTIKSYLPNLEHFEIQMTGYEKAEDVCGKTLTDTALSSGGSVRVMRIYLEGNTLGFHNIVRCLYGVCAPEADIIVGLPHDKDGVEWEYSDDYPVERCGPTDFLKYLQDQSIERRRYLATADFPALGITRPGDIRRLRYHTTGAPRSLWTSKARAWDKDVRAAEDLAKQLESSLGELSAKVGRVRAKGKGKGSGPLALAEAEAVLEAYRSAKRIAAEIGGHLDSESDLAQCVALLRRAGLEEQDGGSESD